MTGRPYGHAAARALSWPAHRPGTTLFLAAVLAAAAGLAASRIRIEASVLSMLEADNPAAAALARISQNFSVVDELLLLVTAPDDMPAEQAAPQLQAFAQSFERTVQAAPGAGDLIQRVVYRAGEEPRRFLEDVLVPNGTYYLDEDQFELLRQRLGGPQIRAQIEQNEILAATPGPAAARLARQLLRDPLRLREFLAPRASALRGAGDTGPEAAFISPDGRALLIRVWGRRPLTDLDYARRLTQSCASAAAAVPTSGLSVRAAGGYAIAAASARILRRDITASVTSSIILQQILFLLMYRGLTTYAQALVPVALGILAGFGVYGLFGTELSPLAAVTGAILAGLGIDYSVHYLAHYTTHRHLGLPADQAAQRTSREIALALASACGTSIVGFLAVAALSVPALRQFAVLGATGLGGALAACLTVLPALVVWLDRAAPDRPFLRRRVTGRLTTLHPAAMKHRGRCIAVFAGLALACGVVCAVHPDAALAPEPDLTVMHPQPNEPLETEELIGQRFSGASSPLLIRLQAATDEKVLELAHDVASRLSTPEMRQAGVSRVWGPAALLPDPRLVPGRSQALRGLDVAGIIADFDAAIANSIFDPAAYSDFKKFLSRLLTPRAALSLTGLRDYPLIAATMLPRPAAGADHVAAAGGQPAEALITVFHDRPLQERARRHAVISAIRAALHNLEGATLTGVDVLAHDVEHAVRRDLIRLLGLAGAVVVGWLWVHFRDWKSILLCLLPVAFGTLVLAAYMPLAGERLNMINLIAAPLLIGLGVDYGIFLLDVDRQCRRAGRSVKERLAALAASCHAIFMASATTALAFGSLVFTSTPAIRSLGRLMALSVTAAALASLFVVAPLLAAPQDQGRGPRAEGREND